MEGTLNIEQMLQCTLKASHNIKDKEFSLLVSLTIQFIFKANLSHFFDCTKFIHIFRKMDKNFSIKAVLFWSEVFHKMTPDCNYTCLETFNVEKNSKEDVDDFKNLLNTPSVKIVSGFLSFFLITFTNAFNILVLMVETH